MHTHSHRPTVATCAMALAASAITLSGQYSLTVNQDRLINAANEPQKMHVQDAYILRLPKKVTDPDFEAVRVERLDDHFKAFLALKDVFAWHEAVTK